MKQALRQQADIQADQRLRRRTRRHGGRGDRAQEEELMYHREARGPLLANDAVVTSNADTGQ
jgi:hypothetical protein